MKDSFFDLSKAVWKLLQNQHKAGNPLLTIEKRKANWTPIGLIVSKFHEFDMVEFLKRHMSVVKKMPEFERCIEVMKKDEVVNNHLECRVGAFTSASILQTPTAIELFLTNLMSELKGLDLEVLSFLKVYQLMEDFFYTNSIGVEVFVHLEGFVSEAEKLELGDGWEISRIPQTQFDELLTDGLLEEGPRMSRYALYWRLSAPKIILKNNEEMSPPLEYRRYEGTARKTVSALRLFKPGDVGFRRIIRRFTGWLSESQSVSTSFMRPFWGTPYSFDVTEIDEFRTLLNLIRRTTLDPAFELSLRRLNDAVERQHPYDMLIDYMIAFEALFLFKNDKKKPVLPKRVAATIHKNDSELDTVLKDMEFAYDLRNSIAHGDTESETQEILKRIGRSRRDFVDIVGGYLRKAIRWYLMYISKGYSKKETIQELENTYPDK